MTWDWTQVPRTIGEQYYIDIQLQSYISNYILSIFNKQFSKQMKISFQHLEKSVFC